MRGRMALQHSARLQSVLFGQPSCGDAFVEFLLQGSGEDLPSAHIYSVLEGGGIYVPTEVGHKWGPFCVHY